MALVGLFISIPLPGPYLGAQTSIDLPAPSSVVLSEGNIAQPVASRSQEAAADEQNKEKIAGYFKKWEEALEKLKRLECSIKFTTVDQVFNVKENQTGTYRFLKIKEQAETKLYRHLDLDYSQPNSSKNLKIINEKLYSIINESKNISVLNINDILFPEKKAERFKPTYSWPFSNFEDSFIIVVLTFKPNQILNRYLVNLAKEDDYYLHFDLYPKSKEDKSLFNRGRLVLLKSTFLPRQIWCDQTNQAEALYEFTNMDLNPDLKVSDFAAPDMGSFKGWNIQDSTRSRLPIQDSTRSR